MNKCIILRFSLLFFDTGLTLDSVRPDVYDGFVKILFQKHSKAKSTEIVKKRTDFVSIRRFVLALPALVLVLVLLAGVFPGGAAYAEEGGDPLALRFVCDETVASVTVYDPAGVPLPVGADGIHHLTPGTYFYSATAEGYENTGLQAFTIPADAAGDQELRISLTPVPGSVPPDASAPGQTPSDALVPGQLPQCRPQ